MSATGQTGAVTPPQILAAKGRTPLVCLTAYTTPVARLADRHCDIVLVGDLGFFGRIGFEAREPGRIRLPGPADPRRVLVRALTPGAWDGLEGELALP